MLIPILIANAAVGLGALVAFIPGLGGKALLPVRILAMIAAVGVVLFHLVPESFHEIGWLCAVGLVVGLLLPLGVEKVANAISGHDDCDDHAQGTVAAHVSFAGLLVHQVGDGMGLFAYASPGHTSIDVALALAAHTVPLTMLVVMQAQHSHNKSDVWRRPLLLAVASTAGVLCGQFVPSEVITRAEPWTASLVSGLLLHVVLHGLSHKRRLDTPPAAP